MAIWVTTKPAKPSIGRRLVARIIDGVVLVAIAVTIGGPLEYGIGWLIGTAIGVYAYFVVCDTVWGATLGKRLVGVHLVDDRDASPMVGAAAAREAFTLLGAVPFAGPVLSLIAGLAIGMGARRDPDGRGFHDRLGGTRVRSR